MPTGEPPRPSRLLQPGPVNTPFDTNMVDADTPLPVYARRRAVFDEVVEAQMRSGDDPTVVAKAVVAAVTDTKPKLSCPAGSIAARASVLRRIVPTRAFDKSVRKLNRMVD
ncbi:hypothetical protein [Streptomyces sp. NPDC047061]|uniref:hypothetical protein n=1 Tax=Streptomyces sp. NPDC047061 TaxID=3154605 RepID=UPI00340C6A0D